MSSKPYSRRVAEKRYSVLCANCAVVGVWGNLKKMCEEMRAVDPAFPSYSSVSKRRLHENPIWFQTDRAQYHIFIAPLK